MIATTYVLIKDSRESTVGERSQDSASLESVLGAMERCQTPEMDFLSDPVWQPEQKGDFEEANKDREKASAA